MDLTVIATPFFFGSMEAERRWMFAHADDDAYAAGQYERPDTVTNLTMGTASLLAPFAASWLRDKTEWGRGRWAKPLLATAVVAGAAATVSDSVGRRLDRRRAHVEADPTADRRRRRLARFGGAAAAVSMGSAMTVVASTWTAKLSGSRLWEHRRWDLGNGIAAVTAATLGWDFIYYWNHRFMHEARYMWAIHVVHHSSEHYNLSVALRQTVADMFGTFLPYGLLSLVGVNPVHIETARGLNLIYQYWIHTEAIPKLGVFEQVMNTASAHRVHHGVNPEYIDRNHGSIFIIWDRLFGTFAREDEPVVYGLTKNVRSFNPVRVVTHEYVDMARDVAGSDNWRDRLSYVFKGPGWSYARNRDLAAA